MSYRKAQFVVMVLLGAVLGAVGASAQQRHAAKQVETREAQVLAWIVEHNPSATIREFSGFPKTLLDEAAKVRMDYRVVMAVIYQESEFNPRAIGKSGEIGLMQIMPSTAVFIAKDPRFADYVPPVKGVKPGQPTYSDLGSLGDPRYNIRMGLAHLRAQVEKYGSWPVALRAYNRGDASAKAHRPGDRYAENIALTTVTLLQRFPR